MNFGKAGGVIGYSETGDALQLMPAPCAIVFLQSFPLANRMPDLDNFYFFNFADEFNFWAHADLFLFQLYNSIPFFVKFGWYSQ